MHKLIIAITLVFFFCTSIKTQVSDIFEYKPIYKLASTEVDLNRIEFVSYNSNSGLKDLVEKEGFDNPLSALDKFTAASSIEEVNSIT